MIRIIYSKEGTPINDFNAEEIARGLASLKEVEEMEVSSEIFLLAVRTLKKEGYYGDRRIVIIYDGKDYEVDNNGKFSRWDYACSLDHFLNRLIGL